MILGKKKSCPKGGKSIVINLLIVPIMSKIFYFLSIEFIRSILAEIANVDVDHPK